MDRAAPFAPCERPRVGTGTARAARAWAWGCVVGVVLGAAGCERPCETPDNCKRTCACVDAQTEFQSDCTLAFRCESAEQVCEADYADLSCDDVCQRYAAQGKCGFQRCQIDAECVRQLTCPVRDAQGAPTTLNFDCTLNFVCVEEDQLCQAGAELPNEQLCLECERQAAGG